MTDSPWLTRPQAAERANVSLATLDRALRTGDLRSSRPGRVRRVLIRVEWLDDWLAKRPRR